MNILTKDVNICDWSWAWSWTDFFPPATLGRGCGTSEHKLSNYLKKRYTFFSAFVLWLIFWYCENWFHNVWLLPVLDIAGLFHSFCYMSSLEIRKAIYNFLCRWQRNENWGSKSPFLTIVGIRNILFCFCKQSRHKICSALNLVSPLTFIHQREDRVSTEQFFLRLINKESSILLPVLYSNHFKRMAFLMVHKICPARPRDNLNDVI